MGGTPYLGWSKRQLFSATSAFYPQNEGFFSVGCWLVQTHPNFELVQIPETSKCCVRPMGSSILATKIRVSSRWQPTVHTKIAGKMDVPPKKIGILMDFTGFDPPKTYKNFNSRSPKSRRREPRCHLRRGVQLQVLRCQLVGSILWSPAKEPFRAQHLLAASQIRIRCYSHHIPILHWIGWMENLQETMAFIMKYRGFLKFFP